MCNSGCLITVFLIVSKNPEAGRYCLFEPFFSDISSASLQFSLPTSECAGLHFKVVTHSLVRSELH